MLVFLTSFLQSKSDLNSLQSEYPVDSLVVSVSDLLQTTDTTVMQMAIELFDVLLKEGIMKFHLIGFGIGGMICLQLVLLLRGRDDFECQSLGMVSACNQTPARGMLQQFNKSKAT